MKLPPVQLRDLPEYTYCPGVVGLVFGAFGECSQSVDLLVESFGKLIGEQGYAEMGYRTPEVGVGVATWAIRRE